MAKRNGNKNVIVGLRVTTEGNVRYCPAPSKVNSNLIYILDIESFSVRGVLTEDWKIHDSLFHSKAGGMNDRNDHRLVQVEETNIIKRRDLADTIKEKCATLRIIVGHV